MKSILVVCKNFEFCKELNNEYCDKARIINISSSYEEGIKNILLKKPNVIILKIRIKYYEIIDLISKINKLPEYNPLILLISNANMYDIQKRYKKFVVIKDDNDVSNTFNMISKYVEFKIDCLEKRITEEMLKTGFEMKNKGDYLILKVIEFMNQNKGIGTNLERDVYPKVASTIKISEKQIKWNINYSIDSVYSSRGNIMCKYLGISNYEKPTSKLVISSLLNRL